MLVDIGWSNAPDAPARWIGGKVSGIIGRDRAHRILLVADRPAPGLSPSAYPDPNAEPNNHLSYAVQWFALRRDRAGDLRPRATASAGGGEDGPK